MKIYVPVIAFFFSLLFTSYSFAGTTTLTTYYPPPTAAYNKVNLSTAPIPINAASTTCCTASTVCSSGTCAGSNGACGCCNSSNVGFNYTYGTNIYACTNTGISILANGNLHGDSLGTGTLHVVMMGGQDIVYPPECYNKFCSYSGVNTCTAYMTNTAGNCQPGFTQIPVNSSNGWDDSFQTSPTTTVISIACCSTGVSNFIASAPAGSTTYPADEGTAPPS